MSCNCGGGKAKSLVAATAPRHVTPGEEWEAVLPDGSTVVKASKRQAEAVVAMRGGRVRRLTRKVEGA